MWWGWPARSPLFWGWWSVLLFLDSTLARLFSGGCVGVAGWNVSLIRGCSLVVVVGEGSARCWVLRRHLVVFFLVAPGLDRLMPCVGWGGGGCGGLGCGCVLSVA